MVNNNVTKINYKLKNRKVNFKHKNTDGCKIYTPEIISKYKNNFKRIFKITNDKNKTKYIMYNKVLKWYESMEQINISMEKIYVKTKLGSYTSGGCGISASFLAGLTSSGIIYYIDNFIKEIGPYVFPVYFITTIYLGIKILSNEDNKVEMYNIFLEALNNIEYHNNDNRG